MFFFVALAVIMIIAYLLIPVPQGSSQDAVANTIGDFDFPTNSNSRAVPILFGTAWASGNNIYYGNLKTSKIMSEC